MDSESQKYEFRMSEQDFLDFVKIANRKICQQAVMLQIIGIVLLIVIFAVVPDAVSDFIPSKEWSEAPYVVKNILVPCITFLFVFGFIRVIYAYLFKAAKISYILPEGAFLRSKTTTMDEEGISEETEYGISRMKWAGILAIENHEKIILFYVDRMSAYVAPKNGFSSSEDAENFYRQAVLYWQNARSQSWASKNPWARPPFAAKSEEKISDASHS